MANQYTIDVQNDTSEFRDYFLFSEKPEISNMVQDKIFNNGFAVPHAAPGQATKFTIHKQYFAMVGTANGSPASGVTISVSGTKPVTLGSTNKGVQQPGTTLELDAYQKTTPYFTPTILAPC